MLQSAFKRVTWSAGQRGSTKILQLSDFSAATEPLSGLSQRKANDELAARRRIQRGPLARNAAGIKGEGTFFIRHDRAAKTVG